MKCDDFKINENLSDYIITLLGYTKVDKNGNRHTNWFPWNRFKDVFETLGYKCEWIEFNSLKRNNEKRLFITWNEPTCQELVESKKLLKNDIIFQKLTSLGKGMNDINWTNNPKKWCTEWSWPIYKSIEILYDKGINIYGFGCKSSFYSFPEKKRICLKLKNRIFWISWGGTPFNWEQIKNSKPNMNNLTNDISYVGSKWGKVGRGNVDSWDNYIKPLEKSNFKFKHYGGAGKKMVTDDEMIKILSKSKLCPIMHAPSWQAERGVQDRFYTVFLCGRFGICDNLGAVDMLGKEIKDICTENPKEYYDKSIYYLKNVNEQLKYINIIQKKIKERFNFYRQWEQVLNSKNIITNKSFVNIMGNGPSLKNVNLKNLNDNILVSFNRAYIIYEKENIYPDYYICIDKAVLLNCLEDIKKLLDSKIKFFILLECDETKHLKSNYKVTLISKNSKNQDYFGDVATLSINYLINKGFKNFNVYGCDCSYIEDYKILNVDIEYNQNDPARRIVLKPKKGSKDPNHFVDNYFDDTTEYSIPRTNNHLNCWKNIFKIKNINIIFKTKSKAESFK